MRKLLTLTALLLFNLAFSQETIATHSVSIDKDNPITDWTTYVQNERIRIEYTLVSCYPNSGLDFETILLRFTNLTSQDLEIDWHIDLFYDGTCRTCGVGEYERTMPLSAHGVLEGSCDNLSNKKLELFSKFIDPAYTKGAQLTSFQLNNLLVH